MNQKIISPAGDDFTQIKGIGPKTQARLYQAGVLTYAQLAQATTANLADIAGTSQERIVQDDWQGHAQGLVPERAEPVNGQHYATFTVELLLDPNNHVRRTRVVHVQDEAHKAVWAGWEDARLVHFISSHAGLGGEVEAEETVSETAVSSPPLSPPHRHLDLVDEQLMIFTQQHLPVLPTSPPPATPLPESEDKLSQGAVVVRPARAVLEHGRFFDVHVRLDLSNIPHDNKSPLRYQTAVFAVDIRAGKRQEIGTAHGSVAANNDEIAIQLPAQIQHPGTYRLEAETNLVWLPPTSSIATAARGTLVHIY